jgi:splicing factor 45
MSSFVVLVSYAQYAIRYEQGKSAANAPPAWDPTEPYDPRAPNDYYEYKAWKQREHEESIARQQAELREESRGRKRSWKDGDRSDESDDASEDSRDYDRWQNRPRKTGMSGSRLIA